MLLSSGGASSEHFKLHGSFLKLKSSFLTIVGVRIKGKFMKCSDSVMSDSDLFSDYYWCGCCILLHTLIE